MRPFPEQKQWHSKIQINEMSGRETEKRVRVGERRREKKRGGERERGREGERGREEERARGGDEGDVQHPTVEQR